MERSTCGQTAVLAATALVAWSLQACGGKEKGPAGDDGDATTETADAAAETGDATVETAGAPPTLALEVGTEGALLVLPGGASLFVPEGALDQTVLIAAEVVAPPDITDAETAGLFYRLGPSGLSLLKPAEIRFPLFWYPGYADAEKAGRLRIATKPDDSEQWTFLETQVHSDMMIVSAGVEHFSGFGMVHAQSEAVNIAGGPSYGGPCSTNADCAGGGAAYCLGPTKAIQWQCETGSWPPTCKTKAWEVCGDGKQCRNGACVEECNECSADADCPGQGQPQCNTTFFSEKFSCQPSSKCCVAQSEFCNAMAKPPIECKNGKCQPAEPCKSDKECLYGGQPYCSGQRVVKEVCSKLWADSYMDRCHPVVVADCWQQGYVCANAACHPPGESSCKTDVDCPAAGQPVCDPAANQAIKHKCVKAEETGAWYCSKVVLQVCDQQSQTCKEGKCQGLGCAGPQDCPGKGGKLCDGTSVVHYDCDKEAGGKCQKVIDEACAAAGKYCKDGQCAGGQAGCKCGDAGVTIEAVNCNWPDATQCSGLASAYCGSKCGDDYDCMTACDAQFPETVHEDGATYTAWDCTLKIHCP